MARDERWRRIPQMGRLDGDRFLILCTHKQKAIFYCFHDLGNSGKKNGVLEKSMFEISFKTSLQRHALLCRLEVPYKSQQSARSLALVLWLLQTTRNALALRLALAYRDMPTD